VAAHVLCRHDEDTGKERAFEKHGEHETGHPALAVKEGGACDKDQAQSGPDADHEFTRPKSEDDYAKEASASEHNQGVREEVGRFSVFPADSFCAVVDEKRGDGYLSSNIKELSKPTEPSTILLEPKY
jgi:hypothetical protein